MKKSRQYLLVLLCVVVVSLVFYSCEQKTDLNVQNVENKNFLNEIDKCFDTFIHSKLRGTSQLATTRHDEKCDKLADDLTMFISISQIVQIRRSILRKQN